MSDSGRRDAERRLAAVESEHEELDIRPLSEAARERYLEEWRGIEARFVNDPRTRRTPRSGSCSARSRSVAIRRARRRGARAHLAVDHPDVVERYRHGRAMLGEVRGAEGTENLRKAMLDFRAVFEEVVERERTAA